MRLLERPLHRSIISGSCWKGAKMARGRNQSRQRQVGRSSDVTQANKYERFLEPVYLNESMVLNCAAYLFKGVNLESERTESESQQRGVSANIGLPSFGAFFESPRIVGGINSSQ